MVKRNAAAPWFYAVGSVVLGYAGYQAFRRLRETQRARSSAGDREQLVGRTGLQQSRQTAPERQSRTRTRDRNAEGTELNREELEALLSGGALAFSNTYDAVTSEELGAEWLTRTSDASLVANEDEVADSEVAELLREAGMSVVSEGSVNWASPDELERAVSADLEGTEDEFELEFDDSSLRVAAR